MKLLVDTDVFCKLAVSGLLLKAVDLLGADLTECGRLPALQYMLKKGGLRTFYGPELCDNIMPIALKTPTVSQPSDVWLDKLTPVPAIDAGEAQIFAAGAENGLLVMTGDKRALRALKDIADFPGALAGRIVVFEAILIALCDQFGSDEVRQYVQFLAASDKMVQICFSQGDSEPTEGLLSYYSELKVELDPIVLWNPRPEEHS